MQTSSIGAALSASGIAAGRPGSGVNVRALMQITSVFANEGQHSFETKRAAWFEYKRMLREGEHSGQWQSKLSSEQRDAIADAVERSSFSRAIRLTERAFTDQLTETARNPHGEALAAANSLSEEQLKYFEIGLLDGQGLSLDEWRGKQGAMSDILEVRRMVDAELLISGSPSDELKELLKALETLYDMVGKGKTKPADMVWPEGAQRFVDRLAARKPSKEPQDVVDLSPEALALLKRQSKAAWQDGSAKLALL